MKTVVDFRSVFGPPGEQPEVVREYLRDLRTNWAGYESSIARSSGLMFGLAAAFLLLSGGSVGTVSLVGVELTSLEIIQASIPVVIGYLAFALVQASALSWRLADTHDELVEYSFPSFYAADLELTLHPPGAFTAQALLRFSTTRPGLGRLVGKLGLLRSAVQLFAPLVFLVYAVVEMWADRVASPVTRSVSTVLTVAMLAAAVPHFLHLAETARGHLSFR